MDYMFSGADSFDGDIGSWVVSLVTSFRYMFYRAYSFNQDIGSWNVSSGETFDRMFNGATSFDQDISSWDVSSGTNFNYMFRYGTFNQDIRSWDVSSEAYISYMFEYNTAMQTGQGVDAIDHSYFIGSTLPAAPVITTSTTLTNDNTPTIQGTAEAGSTVELFNGKIRLELQQQTMMETFIVSSELADGNYSLTVTSTDQAGNTSSPSAGLSITIDTIYGDASFDINNNCIN